MNKLKKSTFQCIILALLTLAIMFVAVGTYAYFSDRKAFFSDNLSFGAIKLKVDGTSISGESVNVSVTRKVGELSSKLMPGDTVGLNFNVSLEEGCEPAYYLIFLNGGELFEDDVFYSDGANKVSTDSSTKKVGALTTDTHTFKFEKTISEDYEQQGSKVKISLDILAIQQANLTEAEAYDEIYKRLEANTVSLGNDVSVFRTVLGGDTGIAKYTKIGFYDSTEFGVSTASTLSTQSAGYVLDDSLTATLNEGIEKYTDEDLIYVFTNGTEIAFVSDYKIIAPIDCSKFFNSATAMTTIDLTNIDFSKTKNMSYMFQKCQKLETINGLDTINTSKVTDMSRMFDRCLVLKELDVSNFDTSKVTDMCLMFQGCQKLTTITGLNKFNTSKVTDMHAMFNQNINLTTLDVSSFNTSNVTNMAGMFGYCQKLATITGLNRFNTSKVTDMQVMFQNCQVLTSLDVSSFNTSKVTTMYLMFNNCQKLTTITGLNNFNTSNVTNMVGMFQHCQALTNIDVSSFNTSNVTNMQGMFNDCQKLTNVSGLNKFNTSKVTNMQIMFQNCQALTSLDVSSFNTEKVTDMSFMFQNCQALTSLDVSSFNTSNVTTMNGMFRGLGLNSSATEISIVGLENFDTSNVTDMSRMFANGENYTGSGRLTNATLAGISNWNVSKVQNMTGMFYGQGTNLTTLDVSKWNTQSCKSFNHLFADCMKLTSLDLSNWNTQNVRSVYNMFNDCCALTTVGDISNWNTANLYDVGSMFMMCVSLTGKLDLSGWNTQNVRGMDGTFTGCTGLTEIDLSGWNNSNVIGGITEDMVKTWPDYNSNVNYNIYYASSAGGTNPAENMFYGCTNLTKILVGSGWNTANCGSTAFTNCGVSSVTVQ